MRPRISSPVLVTSTAHYSNESVQVGHRTPSLKPDKPSSPYNKLKPLDETWEAIGQELDKSTEVFLMNRTCKVNPSVHRRAFLEDRMRALLN